MKRPVVSIFVNGHGVLDHAGAYASPEELEAIAAVFTRAALALRSREHGRVFSGNGDGSLAEVAIDQPGRPFDMKKGLPTIQKIACTSPKKARRAGKK